MVMNHCKMYGIFVIHSYIVMNKLQGGERPSSSTLPTRLTNTAIDAFSHLFTIIDSVNRNSMIEVVLSNVTNCILCMLLLRSGVL